MKRILLTATTATFATFLLLGCGHQLMQPSTADSQSEPSTATSKEKPSKTDIGDSADTEAAITVQQPGDFVIYQFSGSYRKQPLTLTRRVVERNGDTMLVDVRLEDGKLQERLRLRIRENGHGQQELLSVARFDGDVQQPFGIEAYEKLMARTMLAADDNEGLVDETAATVKVGATDMPCTKRSYRVRIGDQFATMITFESSAFPWGDLGGQIIDEQGRVLYQAQVVTSGSAEEPWEILAAHDDEEYEDDYEGLD